MEVMTIYKIITRKRLDKSWSWELCNTFIDNGLDTGLDNGIAPSI